MNTLKIDIHELLNETNVDFDRIPLETFFKHPKQTGFEISPNGKIFSYLAPINGILNIFIRHIDSDKSIQLTNITDRDVAGTLWGDDEHIMYLKDIGGDENFQLFSIDIKSKKINTIAAYDNVRVEIINDLPSVKDKIIIGMNKENPEVFDPYELNTKTGKIKHIIKNSGNITNWIFDHDGNLRMYEITDGLYYELYYRDITSSKFKRLLRNYFTDVLSPLFFTFDNTTVHLSKSKISI